MFPTCPEQEVSDDTSRRVVIAGYPPIRFAHSGENQVLRKSKRYASFFFFFLPLKVALCNLHKPTRT